MHNIYLASSSPRRRELLQQIKLPHKVIALEVDESLPGNMPPAEQVMALSRRKAEAAGEVLSEGLVIAADTIVVAEGDVLGKPAGKDGALTMLQRLQGTTHEVYTGLTVLELPTRRALTAYERTEVEMRPVSSAELMRYIETGEPIDKAGAYGVQGLASIFVSAVRGCYFNVVGLPVFKLALLLKELGVDVSEYWG